MCLFVSINVSWEQNQAFEDTFLKPWKPFFVPGGGASEAQNHFIRYLIYSATIFLSISHIQDPHAIQRPRLFEKL